jgi:hypothetical protein
VLTETLKAELATLPDESAIAEVCAVLKQRRVEIMNARCAGLSDYPVIAPVNGVRGAPTRVTRAAAKQCLRSGTHKLVTP